MKPEQSIKRMNVDILEDISDGDQRDGDLFSHSNSIILSTESTNVSQK